MAEEVELPVTLQFKKAEAARKKFVEETKKNFASLVPGFGLAQQFQGIQQRVQRVSELGKQGEISGALAKSGAVGAGLAGAAEVVQAITPQTIKNTFNAVTSEFTQALTDSIFSSFKETTDRVTGQKTAAEKTIQALQFAPGASKEQAVGLFRAFNQIEQIKAGGKSQARENISEARQEELKKTVDKQAGEGVIGFGVSRFTENVETMGNFLRAVFKGT